MNAYFLSREKQYKFITPRLICESLIGTEPNDYKFFCFLGDPKLVQIDKSRHSNHMRSFYSMEWEEINVRISYPNIPEKVSRPSCFEQMKAIASALSEEFEFARIDLYEIQGKVYFGEITLFPGGGTEPFASYEQDLFFGRLFDSRMESQKSL